MPFNSDTYHGNKARRQSRALLAQARELKARLTTPEDAQRLAFLVQSARTYNRIGWMLRRDGREAQAARRAR